MCVTIFPESDMALAGSDFYATSNEAIACHSNSARQRNYRVSVSKQIQHNSTITILFIDFISDCQSNQFD